MTVQIARRLFTVEDYHRMAEAGVFGPDERVELIEGELVPMSPIGRQHAACVTWLDRHFQRVLGDRAVITVQNPVELRPRSEPQPDVALLKWRKDLYRGALPTGEDTLLAIEVADTTCEKDRAVKIPLYARQGIVESWIVDIPGEAIEVFLKPGRKGYRKVTRHACGKVIRPAAFPDVSVAVHEVLGLE